MIFPSVGQSAAIEHLANVYSAHVEVNLDEDALKRARKREASMD